MSCLLIFIYAKSFCKNKNWYLGIYEKDFANLMVFFFVAVYTCQLFRFFQDTLTSSFLFLKRKYINVTNYFFVLTWCHFQTSIDQTINNIHEVYSLTDKVPVGKARVIWRSKAPKLWAYGPGPCLRQTNASGEVYKNLWSMRPRNWPTLNFINPLVISVDNK